MPMFADDGNESPPAKPTIVPVAIRSMSATVDLQSTIAPEALAEESGRDESDDGGEQREGEHESEREGEESGAFDESDRDDNREMTAQRIAVITAKEAFGGVGRAVEVQKAFVGDSGREEQLADDQQDYKREGKEDEDEDGGNEDEEGESSDHGREESDGDGECDWAAEAQKPPETKGYQGNRETWEFRFRQMAWEQRDGRWHGEWRWTKWEHEDWWEKRVEADQERVIRAWNVTGAPQEVLLQIIECLVGRRRPVTLEYSSEIPSWVGGLYYLALVCRAWYNLVEPALYSRLEARDELLGSPLRQSLALHARRIKVSSIRPIITSARLTRSAPRPSPAVELYWKGPRPSLAVYMWLRCNGPEEEGAREAAAYHPSHVVIYSQLHRSYSNVIRLDLHRCTFLSSSDLLRLLASFSALEDLSFSRVSVAHVSDSVILRGRSSTGVSRSILVGIDCTPSQLPFLTHCWTWTCEPPNQQATPFHGLIPAEQRLAARFVGFVGGTGKDVWYHLDAMDIDGGTWVAWMEEISLHVEFHTLQNDSLRPAAACVQHCLLHVKDEFDAKALMEGLTTISDTFTRFAYLESIVLETGHQVTTDKIQPLLETLRKICRVEVLHRTFDDGHKTALQAKKSSSRSAGAGLLSPFWCLEKHTWSWKHRLSGNYWGNLKDEDKQGWDPSRPRTTSPAASK